jgi:RNA-directed DNA polymerase
MSLGRAVHQKPGDAGRNAGGRGEADPKAVRDEARTARHANASPGREDLIGSACLGSHDLNCSNRPVRTRMPGGVGGERSGQLTAPIPIVRVTTKWLPAAGIPASSRLATAPSPMRAACV